MKVIFLDIDGVLVTHQSLNTKMNRLRAGGPPKLIYEDCFDHACIERLNRLVKLSGAKIVISSAWRLHFDFDRLKEILKKEGVEGEIIDRTPELPFRHRGVEIDDWLGKNEEKLDIEDWVILDDNSDMVHLRPWFVQTSLNGGLQDDHVEAALNILNVKAAEAA